MCAGVVKPGKVYPKNPAQHAADFKKLASVLELEPVFSNHCTGLPKRVACIRVDGAGDEGPGHVKSSTGGHSTTSKRIQKLHW